MPIPLTPLRYSELGVKHSFEWLGPEVPNTRIKTGWMCLKCGEVSQKSYSYLRSDRKCKGCDSSTRRHSPEKYHLLAELRNFSWMGPEVPDVMTKTWWRCSKGHEWQAKYNHIKNGRGCPHCSGYIRKSPEDYHKLAEEKGGFTWLGPVVPNNNTKTTWRCDAGHEFSTNYNVLRTTKGKGCPHCSGKAHKTAADYHQLAKRHSAEWIGKELPPTVFGKTQWRCERGHLWASVFHHLDEDHGCSVCSREETESQGEKRIVSLLTSFDFNFTRQKVFEKCKDKNVLRFDFYFMFAGQPFLIEYNGEQHYRPVGHWGGEKAFEASQRRDKIKATFACANNIHLIIIPYSDYEKIGSIIVETLTDITGVSPLNYERPARARGRVEVVEGIQLALDFRKQPTQGDKNNETCMLPLRR